MFLAGRTDQGRQASRKLDTANTTLPKFTARVIAAAESASAAVREIVFLTCVANARNVLNIVDKFG